MGKLNKDAQGFTIIETLISLTILSSILLISTLSITYIGKIFYKANALAATENNARDISSDLEQDIQYSDGTTSEGEGYILVNGDYIPEYSLCIDGDVRYTFTLGYELNSSGGSEQDVNGKTIPYLSDVLWRDDDNTTLTPASTYYASAYPGTSSTVTIPVVTDLAWTNDYSNCTPVNLNTIKSSTDAGQELLQNNSRLTDFDEVTPATSLADKIDIGVAYGPLKSLSNVSTTASGPITSIFQSLLTDPYGVTTLTTYDNFSTTSATPPNCLTQLGDQDCAAAYTETAIVPRGN